MSHLEGCDERFIITLASCTALRYYGIIICLISSARATADHAAVFLCLRSGHYSGLLVTETALLFDSIAEMNCTINFRGRIFPPAGLIRRVRHFPQTPSSVQKLSEAR